MGVCVYVGCGMAVLFSCTSVFGCPASKEGWVCNLSRWSKQQDTGWAKTNKKNAHETEQQKPQFNPGLRPWRTYSRGAPRRWPFKYVQNYDHVLCYKKKLSWVTCNTLPVINYDYFMIFKLSFLYWSMFIFHRLKINHDSHEFILKFGTVANNYKMLFQAEQVQYCVKMAQEKGFQPLWNQESTKA